MPYLLVWLPIKLSVRLTKHRSHQRDGETSVKKGDNMPFLLLKALHGANDYVSIACDRLIGDSFDDAHVRAPPHSWWI
jgi:hypothetical protein